MACVDLLTAVRLATPMDRTVDAALRMVIVELLQTTAWSPTAASLVVPTLLLLPLLLLLHLPLPLLLAVPRAKPLRLPPVASLSSPPSLLLPGFLQPAV